MSFSSGFFDAELVDGVYDREYVSASFAKYFSTFIGNGVFFGEAKNLQVVATEEDSMEIVISSGIGFINGYYVENSMDFSIGIDASSGTQNRIDSVVLRWDKSSRSIEPFIVKGESSYSAVAKEPTRSNEIYEIVLAHVYVNAGVTKITNSQIADMRTNTNLCGIVTGVVDQIDAEDLFLQFQTAFDEWFAILQESLSGDVAAQLAARIAVLESESLRKANVVNSLTSSSVTNVLAAYQGKVLNDKITNISTTPVVDGVVYATYVTQSVNLGFQPRFVIITNQFYYVEYLGSSFAGATPNKPAEGNYVDNIVKITPTGFEYTADTSGTAFKLHYRYFAFK